MSNKQSSGTEQPQTLSRRMREVTAAVRRLEEKVIDRMVNSGLKLVRLQNHLAVVSDHLKRVLREKEILQEQLRQAEARLAGVHHIDERKAA